jgi:hypothetical protein
MTEPDPQREITDTEFEEMVAAAGELTVRATYPHGVGRRRFDLIRTFQVPLAEISVKELTAHFGWVVARARPYPEKG